MKQTASTSGVSLRALALAVALIPANCYWIIQSELIWYSGHPTTISLFSNVTFILLVVALLNLLVKRWRPGAEFSAGELLTVYVVLAMVSVMCSHDFLQVFIPMVAHPTWHASPENRWDELFFGGPGEKGPVPTWLIVNDESVLRGFYEGQSSLYRWDVLRAWAKPLMWWSTFIIALVLAITALTAIFRRQWVENERLSYPVIQIPLEITTNLSGLLRKKVFWLGFGIAGGIDLMNGLHFLEPRLPHIPLLKVFEFQNYLTTPPWTSMEPSFISIHLFAIGMCFFLPTDLIFSCWFFFLFYRFEEILAGASGVSGLPGFPYISQQSAGGYFGLFVLALWISRRHLAGVFRTVFGLSGGLDDSREPLRYRTLVIVFTLCSLYLIGFGVRAGASLGMMVLFFAIFFAYSIAIARMRAELGPPAHDLHDQGPGSLLLDAFGAHGVGKGNMAVFSLFYWFNRAYRAHSAAHVIEGFKLADRAKIRSRSMFWAILLAVLLGMAGAYWAILHSLYVYGQSTGIGVAHIFGSLSWNNLSGWLQNPPEANIASTAAVGIGFLFSLLLAAMRLRFTWWAFHPVGYAVSSTWSMQHLWFSMLLAWLIKSLMMRYGGARVYRPAVPFFIGLVLGEFVIGSLWTIYGTIYHVPVYRFWG